MSAQRDAENLERDFKDHCLMLGQEMTVDYLMEWLPSQFKCLRSYIWNSIQRKLTDEEQSSS